MNKMTPKRAVLSLGGGGIDSILVGDTAPQIQSTLSVRNRLLSQKFSFESLIKNRNHIVLKHDILQKNLGMKCQSEMIYFVRVPQLNSEERQKIKVLCDSNNRVSVQIEEGTELGIVKISVGSGKLKYSWEVPIESKSQKKKK